jgi:predicted nucleic acid-binding protein
MSALFRRVRAGQIAEREAHGMMRHLADDRAGWQLIGIDSSILGRAESLVRDVTLRALDAIHIASALMLVDSMAQRIPFVTADANQRAAAERANLEVVWIV